MGAPRTPRRQPRRRRAGVTLLELVLVMFVLAIALGTGLGAFAAIDLGRRNASGLVRDVVRSAQNTAVATQAPARVRVDRAARSLTAELLAPVGTWHFEERRLEGGNGLDGVAAADLFVPDGYLGDALSFTDRLGEIASVPVQLDPAFDLAEGFTIECALRLEGVGGGRLLSIGDVVRLELGAAGDLRGSFVARGVPEGGGAAPAGGEVRGGTVVVRSLPGVVGPERWTRVRLSYDRRELVLFVDGLRVAAAPETAAVHRVDGPLVLSDERRPFPGSVDALVVMAVRVAEPAVLAETVEIVSAPERIVFAPGGGLDRRVHRSPPEVVLGFDDGSREVVSVGVFGTVE